MPTDFSQLQEFIDHNTAEKAEMLNADAQMLLNFLVLIVDIKYRHRYGEQLADQHGRGYSVSVQSKVLADHQVSPVDDGLLGH